MAIVKAAASADREKAAALLERIRSENPSHWPYGLYPEQFDPGDLFLIRKEAGADPLGFVGWQERDMGGERVGLYSIGVLPEWRGQGVAKTAVARLIQEKAAGVDRVAALVVEGNTPSEKLAEALGVPRLALQKRAGLPQWLANSPKLVKLLSGVTSVAAPAAGGVATAEVYDTLMPHTQGVSFGEDAARKTTYGLNFLSGALSLSPATQLGLARLRGLPSLVTPGAAKTTASLGTLGIPLVKVHLGQQKALAESQDRNAQAANAIAERASKVKDVVAQLPTTAVEGVKNLPSWALLGGAGLLTAGVGGAAYILQKAIRDKAEAPVNIQTSQGGRLKVTLPTTREGDSETVLDLPFDQENALSNSLRNRLKLDTRRRLYAETKARVKHRGIAKHLPFQVT